MRIPVEFNALSALPESWSWLPLQCLTANPKQDVVDGPFGSNLKASEYVSNGVPIARLQNIDRNAFVTKNIRFLTPEKAANLARHEFRPDDILITKLGDPLGKACIVPHSIGNGVIVADLVRVRVDEKLVDRKYLVYAINSPVLIKQFELHTKGTTRPRVNLSVLRQLPIPIAPREKQTEIVAEIEKQFSRFDEAVSNLKRVKANLKRYKASVLKDAVEGRLVPTEAELARREGRSFETGEQLLQRLLEIRRGRPKGKSKYKEPASPNAAGLGDVPDGWIWASVEQLVAHLTDGDHQAPPQTDSGVPFLVIGDVRSGEVDLTDTRFVGEAYYSSLDPYRQPKLGDLLYTLVGSYGIPVRVKTDVPFCIQRHMAILRPHAQSPMDYLTIAMESNEVFKQATAVATGTAQMTVPLSGLRKIAIGLPPLAEQQRIVAEVDRRLSLVRGVEAEVDANLKRAQALRQSMLSKAFSVYQ